MAFTFGKPSGPKSLGVDLQNKHTTAQHELGLRVQDTMGKWYVYVKAGGTIAVGNLVKSPLADDPYTGVVIATASAAANYPLGMAYLALVNLDFAFILEHGVFEDDAQVVSASVADGDPFVSDANGDCTLAAATDITNARGTVLVDDTDNTGTVLLY